jgi:pimeloyl-ACP methyl ester carboxylesterase
MTNDRYLETSIATHDGLSLYVRDYNAGHNNATPVLCLHGLTRNSKDFEDLAPLFAHDRRVIVPDMRGRGKSSYDLNYLNYQIPTYANDVLALLGKLGITKVIIVGTSMGGLIAMTLAALRPACLAGVALNDIGPEIDPKGLARISSYTGQMSEVRNWQDAADQIRTLNQAAFPDYGPENWMTFARRTSKETAGGVIVADYDPRIGDAIRESSANAAPANLWPLFEMLKPVPLLTIRGEISDILSAETLEKMNGAHPGMKTAIVSGRGHAPALDEPQSLAALQDFITPL